MLLGEKQTLKIVKTVEFGVYLAEENGDEEDKVLLPKKQMPPYSKLGDEIEVFLYRDSKDRLIATTNEPLITLGKIAKLKVVQTGEIGAFLNWGLEKDLLLPFKEQTKQLEAGEEILVALYIDKSKRLCATMKIYNYLDMAKDYVKDDSVTGMVYEISHDFGAFVAVDDKYSALIPKKELYGKIEVGQVVTARITEVKEDGKLDLSIRQKSYLQMGEDAKLVLRAIEQAGGKLPFNDKASPEVIREEMGMSKNEFKRAVGQLYKEKKIVICENSIEIV